jgi:hypothetical protein
MSLHRLHGELPRVLVFPLRLPAFAPAEVVIAVDHDDALMVAKVVTVPLAEMVVVAAAAATTASHAHLGCGGQSLRTSRRCRPDREGGTTREDQAGHDYRHPLRNSHGTCLLGEISYKSYV